MYKNKPSIGECDLDYENLAIGISYPSGHKQKTYRKFDEEILKKYSHVFVTD